MVALARYLTSDVNRMSVLLVTLMIAVGGAVAIAPYGHAYNEPGDFTPDQYSTIASTFPIFTVEKRHAYAVYGNASAPASSPSHWNSIAAAVGTARKIRAINASVQVLMYWNSALHFGFYECEDAVLPSWLLPPNNGGPPRYNYAVSAFRSWWVSCAVEAINGSDGALGGLFLDAVPKVTYADQPSDALDLWGAMVDEVRASLPGMFVIYNGAYISTNSHGTYLANASLLAHADALYVESLANLNSATSGILPADAIAFLRYLSDSANNAPGKSIMGHGLLPPGGGPVAQATFTFGLALFLLITPVPDTGLFLANDGYDIDEGVLTPHPEYCWAYGMPLSSFSVSGTVLTRRFSNATVLADVSTYTAVIKTGD